MPLPLGQDRALLIISLWRNLPYECTNISYNVGNTSAPGIFPQNNRKQP